MSLPEVIPSAMPIFTRNIARTSFSNSVVPSGSVLLFAESDGSGGSQLVKKNPDGTFEVIGGGGGGGSMNFYKCASVNTSNHTWTGYPASIDPVTGIWSFASTATSGLTYDKLVPVAGNVYAREDCICQVINFFAGIPSDYAFYAPLEEDLNCVTNHQISLAYGDGGTIKTAAEAGRRCVRLYNSGYNTNYTIPSGSNPFSLSFWAKADMWGPVFCDYNGDLGFNVSFADTDGPVEYNVGYYQPPSSAAATGRDWHHYCLVCSTTDSKLYVDGEMKTGKAEAPNKPNSTLAFGGWISYNGWNNVQRRWVGYVCQVRAYNRALTSSEVNAIYQLEQV